MITHDASHDTNHTLLRSNYYYYYYYHLKPISTLHSSTFLVYTLPGTGYTISSLGRAARGPRTCFESLACRLAVRGDSGLCREETPA